MEPDKRLLEVVAELKQVMNDIIDKKKALIGLQKDIALTEFEHMEQARILRDEQSKIKYTNQAMRDAYVAKQMSTLTIVKEKEQLEHDTTRLATDVKILDYEFKALIAILNYESSIPV